MNTTLTCILLFLFSFANAQSWDWAKSIGDVSYSEADGVTTDKQGNIYVTGSFRAPTITFGTFTLTNADQSTNQNQDIFVVKYNASGTALWAKRAGNSNMDWSISITTDKNDNVYVLGQYMGAISFDGITLPTSTTLTMFVVKYSSS